MTFVCRENQDGNAELYNTEIGDIYFSNIGAYNEAMQKFVLPAGIENFKNKKIRILDVCYGMGFNSKSFVDYCLKNSFDFEFEIDCIEIDKDILFLGLLILDKNINDDVHFVFNQNLLNQVNFSKEAEKILGENRIKKFASSFACDFNENDKEKLVYLYQKVNNLKDLHNIYYQNQYNAQNNITNIKINFILNDLSQILPVFSQKYDFIFHDAFSILKQPELWCEEIFTTYFKLLSSDGKLLTYSNSRILRKMMNKIGFYVKINHFNSEKQNGTIGLKT